MTRAVVATICARGGSKGLPRKNVLPFAGKPLIAHTIEQARACPLVEAVYVSTDDDEIARVAADCGAEVPYRRPAELATDSAGKLPALEHLLRHLEAAGLRPSTVVDLQPTSPLRGPDDIANAIAMQGEADLVVSVTQPSHNPYYTIAEVRADGTLQPSKTTDAVRRQDVPAVWGLNGSIYVWRRDALPRAIATGFWSVSILPFAMPKERSVDIDDRFDFEMAEWLWQRAEAAR
jgi:N-acylneuraminate cytidylyltransferase